jgi:hypothetical protein
VAGVLHASAECEDGADDISAGLKARALHRHRLSGHHHQGRRNRSRRAEPAGQWEFSKFHLPAAIHELLPRIGEDDTAIVMHNDAVVQGLSTAPFMRDIERWGVLTIGTGLGNASITNRKAE